MGNDSCVPGSLGCLDRIEDVMPNNFLFPGGVNFGLKCVTNRYEFIGIFLIENVFFILKVKRFF